MKLFRLSGRWLMAVVSVTVFAIAGLATALFGQAATLVTSGEAEDGQRNATVKCIDDSNASGGTAVRFGESGGCGVPYATAGAHLPINYALSGLGGVVRYVATTGSDVNGSGSINAPYATLAKAIAVSANGDSIVIRGGAYHEGGVQQPANKSLHITAYPNETPTFSGARDVTGTFVADGTLAYVAYTAQPVTDGGGISFTTGQNLAAGGIGKYPDQAWTGATQLRQVANKADVQNGSFWVDGANGRLYMTATDAAKPDVQVADLDNFLSVTAPATRIEGLKVTRYSNSANDYGVIDISGTADGTTISEIDLSDSAFQSINFSGSSDLLQRATLRDSTISHGNWMGIVALYTDDFVMDGVKIDGMNQFAEFTAAPQSGALKTSRTWHTKLLNGVYVDNRSYGIWFDQSNYDMQVANNYFRNNRIDANDNESANLFFEISDNLLLVNNVMEQTGMGLNFKTAGSSGIKLLNNTIVGGSAPVSVAVDNRSIAGCSDPVQPVCANSYSSDRDSVHPHLSTMDWMPRLDLIQNNIVAYQTGNAAYCGSSDLVCIKLAGGSAYRPLETIIHQTDAARNIPQTVMNGNVYAQANGRLIDVPTFGYYTATNTFTNAMAAAPVSIQGLEQNSLAGTQYVQADGSPTASLAAIHSQAPPVPTDAAINAYIPAGSRHFGVTYK